MVVKPINYPAFDYASGVTRGIEWGRKVLESAAGEVE